MFSLTRASAPVAFTIGVGLTALLGACLPLVNGPAMQLRGMELRFGNWEGANLRAADLRDAKLFGCRLARADLRRARLERATLITCDLTFADLQGVDLRGADLRGSVLGMSDLRGANLRGARLERSDLQEARLDGADLQGAVYDEYTSWPAHFDPTTCGMVFKECPEKGHLPDGSPRRSQTQASQRTDGGEGMGTFQETSSGLALALESGGLDAASTSGRTVGAVGGTGG